MNANYHTSLTPGRFPEFNKVLAIVSVLLLLLFGLLLQSCNMQKYCSEKFPSTVLKKDSVVYIETEKLRDTTIYIPGESYLIFDTIPCDETNTAQLPEKKVKSSRGQLSIEVKNGKLKVACNTDSLKTIIAARDKTISKLQQHAQLDVQTKFVKTKFDRFCNIFFFVVCALLCGYIAGKYFKLF